MVTRIEKFGASWCGPCKVLDRILEQISGIVKHDEELANSKGIRNVPVLIYYNDRDEENCWCHISRNYYANRKQ